MLYFLILKNCSISCWLICAQTGEAWCRCGRNSGSHLTLMGSGYWQEAALTFRSRRNSSVNGKLLFLFQNWDTKFRKSWSSSVAVLSYCSITWILLVILPKTQNQAYFTSLMLYRRIQESTISFREKTIQKNVYQLDFLLY